jgi:hypothetical protein
MIQMASQTEEDDVDQGHANAYIYSTMQAVNKCKVHAWILMYDKILTADDLQKRGWPHQEYYILCNGPLETGLHLSLLCPFARAVWYQVLS